MSLNEQEVEGTTDAAPATLMQTEVNSEPEETNDEVPHLAQEAEEPEVGELERPDYFPEKFWGEDGPDLEKFTESYKNLEKQFSQGKHKAPETYDTAVFSDKNIPLEDPLVGEYTKWAKEFGVNQAAFDKLAGTVLEQTIQNAEAAQIDVDNERRALGPNADAIIKSNIDWADGQLRKGLVTEAERELMNGWGGDAAGQKLLQKVRTWGGDLSRIPVSEVGDDVMSVSDMQDWMSSAMADPRYQSDGNYRRDVEKKIMKYPWPK